MGADNRSELEVVITQIAQGRAIAATAADIKTLTKEVEASIGPGKQAQLNADQLADRLTKIAAASKGAKPGLDGVGEAAKKAAASGKEAARAANEFGENFEKGAGAGRVLQSVLSGNVLAFGQLSGAIKTIGVLLKTNLIGTLVTLGAVAAQVILPLVQGFRNAQKAAEDLNEKIANSERLAQALGDAKTDRFNRELEKSQRESELLSQSLIKNLELLGKRDEAEAALAIARIASDPTKTAQEKAKAKAAVDDDLLKKQRTREDTLQQVQLDQSAGKVVGATKTVQSNAESLDAAQRGSLEATALQAERKRLEEQVDSLLRESSAGDAIPAARQQEIGAELAEAVQRLKEIPSFSELDGRIASANKTIDDFSKKLAAAVAELDKVLAIDESLRSQAKEAKPINEQTRTAEDKTRAFDQSKANVEALKADAAERKEILDTLKNLRGQRDAANAAGNKSEAASLSKQISDVLSSFKPGLKDADKRLAEEQKKEQIDFSHAIHDSTGALIKNTAALSQRGKALNDAAQQPVSPAAPKVGTATLPDGSTKTFTSDSPKVSTITKDGKTIEVQKPDVKPNAGGTIIGPDGKTILVTPGNSVADQQKAAAETAKANSNPKGPINLAPVQPAAPQNPALPSDPGAPTTGLNGENIAAVKQTAEAIATTASPGALDLSPIKDGFKTFADDNFEKHRQSIAEINAQGQELTGYGKRLASLEITVRNQAELAQASA
ncbi:MAG: hypothetical protein ABIZ04_21465 [Opitutus sp.]